MWCEVQYHEFNDLFNDKLTTTLTAILVGNYMTLKILDNPY